LAPKNAVTPLGHKDCRSPRELSELGLWAEIGHSSSPQRPFEVFFISDRLLGEDIASLALPLALTSPV